MLVLSGAFGVISAFLGYYVALWLDTSISGSMAFATGIVFILSFLFSPRHGVLSRYLHKFNTHGSEEKLDGVS